MSRPGLLAAVCLLLAACAGARPAPTPPPAPPTPAGLFQGCEGEEDSDGNLTLDCDPITIVVVEVEGASSDDALRSYAEGWKQEAKSDVQEQPGEVTFLGEKHPVMRASGVVDDEGTLHKVESLALVVQQPAPTRLFVCARIADQHVPEERCVAMLEEVARHGVPKTVPVVRASQLTALDLPGKSVPVPPGCRVQEASKTGALVGCDTGEFWWHAEPKGTLSPAFLDQLHDELTSHLAQQLKTPVQPAESRPACTIAGAPGSCRQMAYAFDKGTLVHLVGVATVNGTEVSAGCSFVQAAGPGPLCGGVFGLR